jgi:phosphatidylserine decarboxylase
MAIFHKEGNTIIASTLLFVGALSYLTTQYVSIVWLQIPILLILLAFLILVLQFFRNPTRTIEQFNDNLVYAPADGKIVVIEETEETEYFKDKRLQISIFMSPLNVHVNRNPFSGIVKYYKYHTGKYLVAWDPKSSTENERTTAVLANPAGKEILFRQIAGSVARRIVCYLNVGDKVTQGEDFGFIKFGSRVDIFLPLGTKINVNIEEVVVGNKTVLAEMQ